MTLKQLKNYVKHNDGATIDATTGDIALLKAGYMVSVAGFETKTTLRRLSYRQVKYYLKEAKKRGAFLGLWLDGDTLYIDISENIALLGDAVIKARDNKQLAIYDIKNTTSIYL